MLAFLSSSPRAAPPREAKNALNARERASRYLAFLDVAHALDIELASVPKWPASSPPPARKKRRVILSFHDFSGTPRNLRTLQKRAAAAGADIFKVAVTPRHPAELAALLALLDAPPVPTSVMGMGPLGKVSRLAAARCGSVLNYGWIERPNVAGQWSAAELRERLAELAA